MSVGTAPFTLSNVTVTDTYGGAEIAAAPPGGYVSVQVTGAAVYYRLQRDNTWDDFETFLGPWVGQLQRANVTGISFRNAAAGKAAQVSASIQNTQDVGAVPSYTVTPEGAVSSTYTLVTGDYLFTTRSPEKVAGAVLCDGTHYDSVTDPSFGPLYSEIGTRYGGTGPSDFAVPDRRDRVGVGAGGNTPEGATEGLPAADRDGPRHRHSTQVIDPGHSHSIPAQESISGATATGWVTGSGKQTGISLTGISVVVGVNTNDPLDQPAFIGEYIYIVK